MKVIGYRVLDFTPKDGDRRIKGLSLFVTEPLPDDAKGEGVQSYTIFLSDEKAQACGYTPKLHEEVRVEYNRLAKVEAIWPVK